MQTKQPIAFNPSPGLIGIPDSNIQKHLGLYHGYVKRFNHCREDMPAASACAKYGLRSQVSYEYDGARLHELYFSQLISGGRASKNNAFWMFVEQAFGSVEAWQRDLIDICHTPGPGWAITYYVPYVGGMNGHIKGHSDGVLIGAHPLLIVDLWEHAYECYATKMEYVQALLANIDWNVIDIRVADT